MTVRELIGKLSELNPDLKVVMPTACCAEDTGGCGDMDTEVTGAYESTASTGQTEVWIEG